MPLVRFPDAAGKTLLLMEYGAERFLGPPDLKEEVMSDVHNIAVREDDVFLCSYPKTGCHWLWEMARLLRAGSTEAEVVEKENYMIEFTSQDDLTKLPAQRVFNTHDYFRQLPPAVQAGKVKLLFIHRNPKDVAVSFYNHHRKIHEYEYQGEFRDYLPELFLKGRVDWGNYFVYLRDWEAVLDSKPDLSVLRLSYEELQADTLGKARELAQFLGSSVDDDTLRDIVNKCSFSSMQERKGKEWIEQYGEPVMYRKGNVGDWKNWFTVAQSEMMDQVIQREMKGSKLQFQYTLQGSGSATD